MTSVAGGLTVSSTRDRGTRASHLDRADSAGFCCSQTMTVKVSTPEKPALGTQVKEPSAETCAVARPWRYAEADHEFVALGSEAFTKPETAVPVVVVTIVGPTSGGRSGAGPRRRRRRCHTAAVRRGAVGVGEGVGPGEPVRRARTGPGRRTIVIVPSVGGDVTAVEYAARDVVRGDRDQHGRACAVRASSSRAIGVISTLTVAVSHSADRRCRRPRSRSCRGRRSPGRARTRSLRMGSTTTRPFAGPVVGPVNCRVWPRRDRWP